VAFTQPIPRLLSVLDELKYTSHIRYLQPGLPEPALKLWRPRCCQSWPVQLMPQKAHNLQPRLPTHMALNSFSLLYYFHYYELNNMLVWNYHIECFTDCRLV